MDKPKKKAESRGFPSIWDKSGTAEEHKRRVERLQKARA